MTNSTVSRDEVTFGLLLFCKTSRRWRRKPSSWDRPSLVEDQQQIVVILQQSEVNHSVLYILEGIPWYQVFS